MLYIQHNIVLSSWQFSLQFTWRLNRIAFAMIRCLWVKQINISWLVKYFFLAPPPHQSGTRFFMLGGRGKQQVPKISPAVYRRDCSALRKLVSDLHPLILFKQWLLELYEFVLLIFLLEVKDCFQNQYI